MYYNDRPDIIENNDLAKLLFLTTTKLADGRTILSVDFELSDHKSYAAPEELQMHLTDGATHTILRPEVTLPAEEDAPREGRWLQHGVVAEEETAPEEVGPDESSVSEEGTAPEAGSEENDGAGPGESHAPDEENSAAPGESDGAAEEASTDEG